MESIKKYILPVCNDSPDYLYSFKEIEALFDLFSRLPRIAGQEVALDDIFEKQEINVKDENDEDIIFCKLRLYDRNQIAMRLATLYCNATSDYQLFDKTDIVEFSDFSGFRIGQGGLFSCVFQRDDGAYLYTIRDMFAGEQYNNLSYFIMCMNVPSSQGISLWKFLTLDILKNHFVFEVIVRQLNHFFRSHQGDPELVPLKKMIHAWMKDIRMPDQESLMTRLIF